jgi:hypothetical protein
VLLVSYDFLDGRTITLYGHLHFMDRGILIVSVWSNTVLVIISHSYLLLPRTRDNINSVHIQGNMCICLRSRAMFALLQPE